MTKICSFGTNCKHGSKCKFIHLDNVDDFDLHCMIYENHLKEIKNLDEKRLRKGHLTFQEAFWLCYELRDYVRDGNIPKNPYHIMSETPFNAEERKILHEHITDLRLYSGSCGSGKNRHIIVSHKFI